MIGSMGTVSEKRLIAFTIRCDWSRAVAPPAIALKRLLKVLGRTYQARCVEARCDEEGDVIPRDLLAKAVEGCRRMDPEYSSHGTERCSVD